MKTPYFYFIKLLILLTSSLALVAFFLLKYFFKTGFNSFVPFVFLFYFVLTASVHFFLLKAGKKRIQRFIPAFMAATSIKLLISLAVLLIYVLTHREEAVKFIIFFFLLYLCYSTFEIISILSYFRKNKELSSSNLS